MAKQPTPLILYHSSGFFTDTLRPGIYYTGEVVRWDETESNEYLYATPFKDMCINLGLSSAVEKRFMLNEFHTRDDEKTLEFVLDNKSQPMNIRQLKLLAVYLYTIIPSVSDKWEPVVNEANTPGTEWKTKNAVSRFRKRERINVNIWLRDKTVIIKHPRFRTITSVPNGNVQAVRG